MKRRFWQDHLKELALAGGLTLAGSACGAQGCNANPDPCCESPDSTACQEWNACIGRATAQCCAETGYLGSECAEYLHCAMYPEECPDAGTDDRDGG